MIHSYAPTICECSLVDQSGKTMVSWPARHLEGGVMMCVSADMPAVHDRIQSTVEAGLLLLMALTVFFVAAIERGRR